MGRFLLIIIVAVCLSSFPSPLSAEVYQLKDGSVKAGKLLSKSGAQVIRLETLEGILQIPSEQINSSESRTESYRLYKEFSGHLDMDKPRSLNTLARWCRQKGLNQEMFELYDRLAHRDRENPLLNEFINNMALCIDYKGFNGTRPLTEREGYDLLKRITRSGHTLSQIGESILYSMPLDILSDVLIKGIESRMDAVQIQASAMVARLTPSKAIEPLIATTLFDRKDEVRSAAISALLAYDHEGIVYPYLRVMKSKVRFHRMNALDALARLNNPKAVGSLINNLGSAQQSTSGSKATRSHFYSGTMTSYVSDFEPEVATGAVIAKPIVNIIPAGVLLDVGVLGTVEYRYISREERARIAQVLTTLTGMDYGQDYLLWKAWWANNRDKFLASGREEQPTGSSR